MVKTNDKKKNTVFINKAEKKKFATEKLKYKTYLNWNKKTNLNKNKH